MGRPVLNPFGGMNTPVRAGQWRKTPFNVLSIVKAHPTRRGFWLVVSDQFPYHVDSFGRKELEELPLASRDYYGDRGHPGEASVKMFEQMVRSTMENDGTS